MNLLKQNHVKYGLIMSGIVALCLILMEITGQNESFDQKSPIFLMGTLVAPFVVWWLGIAARKKLSKGKLTFKQGLTEGFKISLAFGITSPFVFMLYYLLINPEILDYVKTAYMMPSASNGTIIAIDMTVQFVSALIFGSIYAAIISFFLKSK